MVRYSLQSPNISNNGLTRTNRSSHPQGAPQHCSRDIALWAEEVKPLPPLSVSVGGRGFTLTEFANVIERYRFNLRNPVVFGLD